MYKLCFLKFWERSVCNYYYLYATWISLITVFDTLVIRSYTFIGQTQLPFESEFNSLQVFKFKHHFNYWLNFKPIVIAIFLYYVLNRKTFCVLSIFTSWFRHHILFWTCIFLREFRVFRNIQDFHLWPLIYTLVLQ